MISVGAIAIDSDYQWSRTENRMAPPLVKAQTPPMFLPLEEFLRTSPILSGKRHH